MAFYPMHARRFSRDSVLRRHRKLWAWVANCWRLAGFDDDRCVMEGSKAVTAFRDIYDRENELERIPREKGLGPGKRNTASAPSEIRARAILRRLSASNTKKAPHPPGE